VLAVDLVELLGGRDVALGRQRIHGRVVDLLDRTFDVLVFVIGRAGGSAQQRGSGQHQAGRSGSLHAGDYTKR
jgi:hypothetical protein